MTEQKYENIRDVPTLGTVYELVEPDYKKQKVDELEIHAQTVPLSKNQQKKLIKLQQWEIKKVEKRHKERVKARQKRQLARENGLPVQNGPSRKQLKHCKMVKSACTTGVVIDLNFDDYMNDKDVSKVIKQLLHTYTLNRRAENPVQLSFTSLKSGGKMHTTLSKHDGYQQWDVNIYEESFLDIIPKERIVYLTSESDNVLKTIEASEVYIIGGLVDHNKYKGLCFERAKEQNIKHARLPLEEHLTLKTRKALTIDHVFEIMLKVTEGKSWTDALLQVIPLRKGAVAVQRNNDNDSVGDPGKTSQQTKNRDVAEQTS